MKIGKFIDRLISLRIILENREKINIIAILETEKIKEITQKELKELEIKK